MANCASPKDPSAMRAVGVGPVDEITQRARPVNSAALDFVRGALSAKRPHEHANAWCCGAQRISTKCLSQRHHRCVHEDAAQELPSQLWSYSLQAAVQRDDSALARVII